MQAATFGMIAVGIIAWQIMEGFGYTRSNALVAIVWVALSLFLMIMLIPVFKLEGVAFGRMFGCVLMLVYMLLVEKRVFGKTLWSFWGEILLLLFLPAILTVAVEYISLRYFLTGWAGLFTACGLGAVVFINMLFATRFLSLDDKRILHRQFLKVFPRFS
jgi:hypothetical protein